VNRRLLIASISTAVVVSLIGGWALSQADGSGDDAPSNDDIAILDTPGAVQIPSIETNPQLSGDVLAAIDLETNDGDPISTADLIGQPMVLNYWFSTCAPCRKELAAFAAVHAEYGDRVRFVGVNPSDTPEVNESFARDRGVQYELLRDVGDRYGSTIGIATAPFTLFVAADGTIVRQTGVLDEDELRANVEQLLE
jgi:thiol-disulfide isomerase/thioredoxin